MAERQATKYSTKQRSARAMHKTMSVILGGSSKVMGVASGASFVTGDIPGGLLLGAGAVAAEGAKQKAADKAKLAAAKAFAAEHFNPAAKPTTSSAPAAPVKPVVDGGLTKYAQRQASIRSANNIKANIAAGIALSSGLASGAALASGVGLLPAAALSLTSFASMGLETMYSKRARLAAAKSFAAVHFQKAARPQGRAYLNGGAESKAAKPTSAPVKSAGRRPAAAPQPSSNGMVTEYVRRDGTRVQGYRRSN